MADKWLAVRTDFFNQDAFLLGSVALSPAAQLLYIASTAFAAHQGVDHCYAHVARLVNIKRPKPVIEELVEAGFWLPSPDGRVFYVMHEGTLWRRGDGVRRRPISTATRAAVMKRDGFACVECGRTHGLSLDHIWPYSRGGTDDMDNLRVLCKSCNSRKGDRV